jgi:hypothetical protein
VKSPTGALLERASILAVDSKGKRIPPLASGFEGIRCKETRPHALSNPESEGSREEQLEREGRRARRVEELTELERDVLRLQGKLQHRVEQRLRIAAGDLNHYLRDDYTLIPGSEQLEERAGLPPVSTVLVVGYELIQVEALNYDSVAERLGVTVRQVKRAVISAHRKMRSATR